MTTLKRKVRRTRNSGPAAKLPRLPKRTVRSAQLVPNTKVSNPDRSLRRPARSSKKATVLTMLRAASGSTITAIMQETGWQSHSVRGFLAGTVRKKLGLDLTSKTVDGERVYRRES